ncbi:hypothetical protein MLD38_038550 [Melastoma candidum]|uniref:Uncharacterized protein n=1 Tax=Melastoma candidum TaxID=119954 RepID=A0ACB9L0A0_9MYRT|nr:hypothetical protein MLD38_038550 [Melastoma candidum]
MLIGIRKNFLIGSNDPPPNRQLTFQPDFIRIENLCGNWLSKFALPSLRSVHCPRVYIPPMTSSETLATDVRFTTLQRSRTEELEWLGLVAIDHSSAEHVFSGWCTNRDYQSWAAHEKFVVGDTLVFRYEKEYGVEKVTGEDYARCNTGAALYSFGGGETTISLASPGTGYFVCPGFNQCDRGMKVEITVETSNSTATPSESNYPCRSCILCC